MNATLITNITYVRGKNNAGLKEVMFTRLNDYGELNEVSKLENFHSRHVFLIIIFLSLEL